MNWKHPEIEITKHEPGFYLLTGYRAGTVYVPEIGNFAPPQVVDLRMTPDLADALRAVLDDYQPERAGGSQDTAEEIAKLKSDLEDADKDNAELEDELATAKATIKRLEDEKAAAAEVTKPAGSTVKKGGTQ